MAAAQNDGRNMSEEEARVDDVLFANKTDPAFEAEFYVTAHGHEAMRRAIRDRRPAAVLGLILTRVRSTVDQPEAERTRTRPQLSSWARKLHLSCLCSTRQDAAAVPKHQQPTKERWRALLNAALCEAANTGDTAAIDLLVTAGATVDEPVGEKGGSTPLETAAQCGHVEAITRLVDVHGADLRGRRAERFSPLCFAALTGRAEVADLLLRKYGVDVHANDDKALLCAATMGHANVARLLLREHGANVHTNDDATLDFFAMRDDAEMVDELCSKFGARPRGCYDRPLRMAATLAKERVEAGECVHRATQLHRRAMDVLVRKHGACHANARLGQSGAVAAVLRAHAHLCVREAKYVLSA